MMMNATRYAVAAVLALAFAASFALAGPVDDARALLKDKKYDEVDKVLEKALAAKTPDVEALKVSLEASMAAGRFMSAQTRVTALLAATDNKDANLVYMGAEIADAAGDTRMALSRFLAYSQGQDQASERVEYALRYLLTTGAYPEEFKKYVKFYGATDKSWRFGAAQLDRLLDIPDPVRARDMADNLIKLFPQPARVQHVHNRLKAASDSMALGKDPKDRYLLPVQIMAQGKPLDYSVLLTMMRSADPNLTDLDKAKLMFTVQAAAKSPLDGEMFARFAAMRTVAAAEERLKLGKDFLALEPTYKGSADPNHYLAFVRVIASMPEVFNIKDSALVRSGDMVKMFDALKAVYTSRGPIGDLAGYVSRGYIADAPTKTAFLKANLGVLPVNDFRELVTPTEGKNVDELLSESQKLRPLAEMVNLRFNVMDLLVRSADAELKAEAAARAAADQAKVVADQAAPKSADADKAAATAATKAADAKAAATKAEEGKAKDAADKAKAAQVAAAASDTAAAAAKAAKEALTAAQAALKTAQEHLTVATSKLTSARTQLGPVVLSAIKDYLACNPGSFDVNALKSTLMYNAILTEEEKLAVLKDLIVRGGPGSAIDALMKDLAKDKKTWGENPKFLDVAKVLETRKPGSDPLMSAHVTLCSIPVYPQQVRKDVAETVAKMLAAHKGSIPAEIATTQDVLLTNIFWKHLEHVQGTREPMTAWIQAWLPRAANENYFDQLASRARQVSPGLLFGMAQQYVGGLSGNGKDAIWRNLCVAVNPKGNTASPFAKVYDKMGCGNALAYVLSQKDSWDSNRSVFIAEMARLAALPDFKPADRAQAVAAITQLFAWASAENKVPPALVAALYNYLLAEEEAAKSYDIATEASVYGIYSRSGHAAEAARHLAEYFKTVAKRTPAEQFNAISYIYKYVSLPREKDANLQPGSSVHTVLKVLKPLAEQGAKDAWAGYVVQERVYGEVASLLSGEVKEYEPIKADAKAFASTLVHMLAAGAPYDAGSPGGMLSLADMVVKDGIEAENWPLVARLVNFYAGALGYEMSWETNFRVRIQPLTKALETKNANELAYILIGAIERRNKPWEKVHQQMLVIKAKAARGIPGMIPVKTTEATYDLHLAAQALSLGDEVKAWELTERKLKLLAPNWESLDPEYVAWSIEQMRRQKMLKEGLELAFGVLTRELDLSAEVAGKITLAKGDIYKDMENYNSARIEYEGLRNNKRYNKTEAGAAALYHLIDLLILTKDYSGAEGQLGRLTDSENITTQAEAYFLYAKMSFLQADYKASRDYLKKVKERVVNHVEAAFLEGELNLRLPGGLQNTEVKVGDPRLSTVVIPGRVLTLKLQDTNLGVARGGSAIPVVIRTTKGNDVEFINLMPSSSDKYLFVGQINTAIGKVQANDLVLQIRGDDVVSYQIDPNFQKVNDLNYPPKNLEVRFPGRLVASSGEILTEEEEEKRALERQLREKQADNLRRYEAQRDGRTVRPGGGIYVQVTDFARDVSDAADKLTVALRTSSGDAIENFDLVETGEHTGIFRGVVPTGIPLPKANASDTAEGRDASFLINNAKKLPWVSLADAKKPKWVEVDTMSSHPIKEVSIKVEGVEQIKQAVLLGMLADDFEEIASLVEKTDAQKGGLTVEVAAGGAGASPEAMMRHLKLSKSSEYHQDGIVFDRSDTSLKGQSGQMTNRIRGMFWLNEDRAMEFKFTQPPSPNDWQTAYVFIDGLQIMGGTLNKTTLEWTKRVDLVKGAHKLEILLIDGSPASKVILSVAKDDGTYEPMPASLFSIKDNPSLGEYLRPKGKIAVKDGSLVATLNDPVRLRRLRWVFEDFTGNAITASDFTVRDDKGKAITPCQNDFTTGLTNSTLEIAPGDKITVTYNDDKRLGDAPPLLTANLNASFINGDVQVAYEDFVGKQDRRAMYSPAMRCRSGDQLMLIVTDYDEDATDERDVIEVSVRTSSGEQVKLKALETSINGTDVMHKHSGVFMALLRLGGKTEKDTLKVKAGDIITASYLDRENTVPGIPIERSYTLTEAGRSGPKMLVYRTTVIPVEDKSEDAMAKLAKMKLKNKDMGVIYKDQVIARHPEYRDPKEAPASRPASEPATKDTAVEVSVSAPLLLEVNYPKMALNSGSILTIQAAAESELRAAQRDKRKPAILEVPMYIEGVESVARMKGYPIRLQSQIRQDAKTMLRDGTFAGVIRLQIGSPGDPIDDMVTTGEKQFASRAEREEDTRGLQYRVPTLLVSGSDVIQIQVKDADSNEIVRQKVRLLSDGRIELLDQSYTAQMEAIHLGEKFFVKVADPDRDTTDDRDELKVTVRSSSGDQTEMTLTETLAHSGVFTGMLSPEYSGQAATTQPASGPSVKRIATSRPARMAATGPAATSAPVDTLVVNFGDKVTFEYTDQKSLVSPSPRTITVDGRVFFGADGELALFSKQFKDPEMAVKTRFLMAEALFEMAKEHRKLKRDQEAKDEIAKGKQILEEALQDYPNTSLAAQGEFLLANLSEELGNNQEAIARYSHVISTYGESEFAARSQFKKAICLERMENYDSACEEYVKLTYVYPDSPQVADATVRLGNYYYKKQNYKVAGKIFFRFQQRTPGHKLASKSLFLAAQCYYKLNEFGEAIRMFELAVSEYPDDKEVRPEAMYWLADSFFKARDNVKAYQWFKKLTWDYPDSKWAKIARGRLTEEAFSRIEE